MALRAPDASSSTWLDPGLDRRWRHVGPGTRIAFWGLIAVDALLALVALTHDHLVVTTGSTLAFNIVFTIAVVLLAERIRLPDGPVARLQVALLAAMAFHAIGHLWGLYHSIPNYDDGFHVLSMFVAGLIVYDMARSERFVFTTRMGPFRTAVLSFVFVLALAGAWELFEWGGDLAFGSREQDDLFDTMQDMLNGAVGGALAAVVVRSALAAEARHLRQDVARERTPSATRSRT